MKNVIKSISIFVLFLTCSLPAKTQLSIGNYLDLGHSNVSEGMYLSTALYAGYSFDKYGVSAGTQFQLVHPSSRVFTAAELSVNRFFVIGKQTLNVEAFYLYRNLSRLFFERDWGLVLGTNLRHWTLKLGQGFRTYRIRENALSYDVSGNLIRENFNLIYRFSYYVNTLEMPWNISMSLTNMDHFLMNQETNPMLCLRGEYLVAQRMKLYLESWYKSAGSFNISANYFGFFVRTGWIWTPAFGK